MTNMFIVFALFFPRLTLLICWLTSALPTNSTPFFVDILLAIFAPRFLVAFWLYEAGAHPLLIALFILFGLGEMGRGGSSSRSSKGS